MENWNRWFKDPVSGLTHLAGAVMGVVGLIYLKNVAQLGGGGTIATAAVVIYGVSLVLLYGASSTYHLLHVSAAVRAKLRLLDHSMVSVFIAGSYTPFCLIALEGWIGKAVLIAIWAMAFGSLIKSFLWINSPRWVTAGIFVAMGWLVVVAAVPLFNAVSPGHFALIFGGGLAYTVGAAIYAKKWPNPWPPTFGFHEIWHLFVMLGSGLHYVAILKLVSVPQ